MPTKPRKFTAKTSATVLDMEIAYAICLRFLSEFRNGHEQEWGLEFLSQLGRDAGIPAEYVETFLSIIKIDAATIDVRATSQHG